MNVQYPAGETPTPNIQPPEKLQVSSSRLKTSSVAVFRTWRQFSIANPGWQIGSRLCVRTLRFQEVGLAAIIAFLGGNLVASEMVTPLRPYAKVQPLALSEAQWTEGFWRGRFDLCRTQTVPAMAALMEGTNYSQFLENFRVAAGLAPGRHRGAPFNDGDFYKFLEGACATLAVSHDAALSRRIEDAIAIIGKAQRADGYLHTPILIADQPPNAEAAMNTQAGSPVAHHTSLTTHHPFEDPLQFELYNMGHLLTAACVHHQATGRTNFLAIACKTADFLERTFENPTPALARAAICPSHYMGMLDLYRETGELRYRALAKKFQAARDLVTDGTDDNQDRIPFGDQTNAMGHAVRANYLYAGAADLFAETGDEGTLRNLELIWTNVVQQKMYITGGCGALFDGASPDGGKDQKHITRVHQAYGRNYQLPNETAHNETCANIGNVLWNWRMFLATGETRYMDVLELALYNSVLSGMSLDGTNFCYVNPLRSLNPPSVNLRWPHKRTPFLSSFCCPPNLLRTIAESAQYAYARSAEAIWVNLYGGSSLATELPGKRRIVLTQQTDYPWNGHVWITMNEVPGGEFGVRVRIPGWAREASIAVNKRRLKERLGAGTYPEIRRPWKKGDVIDLEFPMPARLIESSPLVEETLNQVAIERGPIVYCLESADVPEGTHLLDLSVPREARLRPRFDFFRGSMIAVVDTSGFIRTRIERNGLYSQLRPSGLSRVPLHFVPYFVWGNRGYGEMTVWVPLTPK